jgi:peptide/nickel transport system permease protein
MRTWLRGVRSRGSSIRHRLGLVVGLAFVGLVLLAAFAAPLPYDPVKPDRSAILDPPSMSHLFGTDSSGFDVFSRTVAAGATDLPLALVGTAISLAIGVPLGLFASVRTKWSGVLMRGLDLFQAFPTMVLTLTLVTILGNHFRNIIIAIAITNIPRFMRLVRSEGLTLRESRFVEAAVAVGASPVRIIFRHILPNITPIILAQASLAVAYAILVIAGLNFLGIGVTIPNPTWGSMIQDGARSIAIGQWWMAFFPGLMVVLVVFALNGVADGIRAVLDPREH